MREPEDVAAVLLAGGQSTRMGFDKTRIKLGDRHIIGLLADRLLEICHEVYVSSNDPAIASMVSLPLVADIYAGAGPLAGVHAAFLRTARPWLLALACDVPSVTADFLGKLCEARAGCDAVIPATSDGRLHPACALYHRNCLKAIERNLLNRHNRMLDLFDGNSGLRLRKWPCRDAGFHDDLLLDLNTAEEYQRFQLRFKP